MKELRWLREEPKSQAIFFHFFTFFQVLCFIRHLGTKTTGSASYGKEKPP